MRGVPRARCGTKRWRPQPKHWWAEAGHSVRPVQMILPLQLCLPKQTLKDLRDAGIHQQLMSTILFGFFRGQIWLQNRHSSVLNVLAVQFVADAAEHF